LTNIEGLKPLVRDEDIVLFGYRDIVESSKYRSQEVEKTPISAFDLDFMRTKGIENATTIALDRICNDSIKGIWIHLDVDVLDGGIMPAVDYCLKNGLTFEELTHLLDALVSTYKTVGMDTTIFNPKLDPDGDLVRKLVKCVSDPLVKLFMTLIKRKEKADSKGIYLILKLRFLTTQH
jgi:arginase